MKHFLVSSFVSIGVLANLGGCGQESKSAVSQFGVTPNFSIAKPNVTEYLGQDAQQIIPKLEALVGGSLGTAGGVDISYLACDNFYVKSQCTVLGNSLTSRFVRNRSPEIPGVIDKLRQLDVISPLPVTLFAGPRAFDVSLMLSALTVRTSDSPETNAFLSFTKQSVSLSRVSISGQPARDLFNSFVELTGRPVEMQGDYSVINIAAARCAATTNQNMDVSCSAVYSPTEPSAFISGTKAAQLMDRLKNITEKTVTTSDSTTDNLLNAWASLKKSVSSPTRKGVVSMFYVTGICSSSLTPSDCQLFFSL